MKNIRLFGLCIIPDYVAQIEGTVQTKEARANTRQSVSERENALYTDCFGIRVCVLLLSREIDPTKSSSSPLRIASLEYAAAAHARLNREFYVAANGLFCVYALRRRLVYFYHSTLPSHYYNFLSVFVWCLCVCVNVRARPNRYIYNSDIFHRWVPSAPFVSV